MKALETSRLSLHELELTDPVNKASINVLTKCGFDFDRQALVFADEAELNIYKFVF